MTETSEQIRSARENIGKAIQAYQDLVTPGEVVTEFLVVTHRNSVELERKGRRSVGIISGTDQSFVVNRGLLEAALDMERIPTRRPLAEE